ncbi:MAG: hypothetical protein KR126chlam5_00624 [Candidatus Anoxychlamydiales bacterium]|nr:hypothetical protein [Candidatus Anoxychlamydiales bacterium]
MFLKLRNVFFVLIAMFFCMNLAHGDIKNTKKNKNHLFKFQSVSKKKNLKDKKLSSRLHRQGQPPSREFKMAWKNSNNKILPIEMPVEILRSPFDCDIAFSDMEVENRIMSSSFGNKMYQHLQIIFDNVKDMYLDVISDLDCDVNLALDYILPYFDVDINFVECFEDLEKMFLMHDSISRNDTELTESIVLNMKSTWIKNMALEGIFEKFLIKNQILDATRIYSMMDYDLDDEDDLSIFSEVTDQLIIALLRNNEFRKAEELVLNLNVPEEFYRDYDLKLIVKYYSRIGDVQNAKRVIEMMDSSYIKTDAKLYIVDFFAREKKIADFQKYVLASDDEDFKLRANFILNIYQNNFEEALKNIPCDYEESLFNIAEIFVSSNRIPEAEYLINCFGDDWDMEDLEVFFVNAYLKNGNADEAKRVRDEIEDPINKIMASKLITAYLKG